MNMNFFWYIFPYDKSKSKYRYEYEFLVVHFSLRQIQIPVRLVLKEIIFLTSNTLFYKYFESSFKTSKREQEVHLVENLHLYNIVGIVRSKKIMDGLMRNNITTK